MEKEVKNVYGCVELIPFNHFGWDNQITFAAATTCYQSEAFTKLTKEAFVERFKAGNHRTPLEFSWYVLEIHTPIDVHSLWRYIYSQTHFLNLEVLGEGRAILSGNGRAFLEFLEKAYKNSLWRVDLNYQTFVDSIATELFWANPVLFAEYKGKHMSWPIRALQSYPDWLSAEHKWYAFRLNNVSIGCTRELNRHRTLSINERSTRYTGCGRDDCILYSYNGEHEKAHNAIAESSQTFMSLRQDKVSNDVARQVLTLANISSEIFAGTLPNLWHFLDLRYATDAHYEIRAVATKMIDIIPARKEN